MACDVSDWTTTLEDSGIEFLIFKSECGGGYVAQGSVYELCTQAKSIAELKYECEWLVAAHYSLRLEKENYQLMYTPLSVVEDIKSRPHAVKVVKINRVLKMTTDW